MVLFSMNKAEEIRTYFTVLARMFFWSWLDFDEKYNLTQMQYLGNPNTNWEYTQPFGPYCT